PEVAAARLQEAVSFGTAATEALSSQTAPEIAAWAWTTQAFTQLDCARLATERDVAGKLEDTAYALARQGLSQSEELSKESRGQVQSTLGSVRRIQASLETGERRTTLLNEAATALREACTTLAEGSDRSAEARSGAQVVLAATLLQHARMAGP